MSRVTIHPTTPDKLVPIATWVLARGLWDKIIVHYAPETRGHNPPPWSLNDWKNAAKLWCDPFYFSAARHFGGGMSDGQLSREFVLEFPDDDTAVMFVLTALGR